MCTLADKGMGHPEKRIEDFKQKGIHFLILNEYDF